MVFTVLGYCKEDQLRFFKEIRHVLNRTAQRRKEVIPMHGNHQFCARLFHGFRKESLFHFRLCFCNACYAEKQDVGLYAIQLAFYVVEAGANQNPLFSMFHVKIIGPALFIVPQAGGLYQRSRDWLPQTIVEYVRL